MPALFSDLPEFDPGYGVVCGFFQYQMCSFARGQDVVTKIQSVDVVPDLQNVRLEEEDTAVRPNLEVLALLP